MYNTLDIINIAKISQYLCENDIDKKGLFGGGVDLLLPRKIYNIRKSVEWLYLNAGGTNETRAIGYIEIDSLGRFYVGINITVYVDDPVLGLLILGSYTAQSSDTTEAILAASLANALSSNTYGYNVTANGNVVEVEARPGLGSTINDANRLQVVTSSRIFNNSFDNTFN
jgi:DUF1009 family protein